MATTRNKKAKQMKQLHAKRAHILGSLNLIRDFDENYDEANSLEIPFRIERLDKLMEELEVVETELDSFRSGDPVFSETLAQCQTLYFRLKSSLSSKRTTPPAAPPAPVHENLIAAAGVRLPELRLPEFDGSPEHWSGFHDLFKTMINDNAVLSSIQKLHYLRSSLKGDAARIICTLPIAATSYVIAWKMICDRFEDKTLLIKQHISALFSITPLRKESASELSALADEFEKHVRILDSLETKAQYWDSVLVELLFSRMDTDTQKLWENQRDKTQRPSYEELLQFTHEHARTLQSLQLSQNAISLVEAKPSKSRSVTSHSAFEQDQRCAVCRQSHFLFQCESFRAHTAQQRFDIVKRSNICVNCLKATHQVKNCSSGACKYCQQKHHTLLHISPTSTLIATEAPPHTQPADTLMLQQELQAKSAQHLSHSPSVALLSDTGVASVNRSGWLPSSSVFAPLPASSSTASPPSNAFQAVTPTVKSDSTVILFTALVKVRDNLGQYQFARALLDSGSQSNFVSESLCQRLGLSRRKVNLPVSGIGQAIVNVRYSVTVNFASRFGSSEHYLECLVLPKLTSNLPTRTVDISTWKIPKHLPLADPQFNVSHGIDLIIGAELFSILLQAEQISFDERLPVLQKTSLGYIISGKVHTSRAAPVTCLVSALVNIDAQVRQFDEIEDADHSKTFGAEVQQCEALLANTDIRTDDAPRTIYVQFMDEHQQLGLMEEGKAKLRQAVSYSSIRGRGHSARMRHRQNRCAGHHRRDASCCVRQRVEAPRESCRSRSRYRHRQRVSRGTGDATATSSAAPAQSNCSGIPDKNNGGRVVIVHNQAGSYCRATTTAENSRATTNLCLLPIHIPGGTRVESNGLRQPTNLLTSPSVG